jgi:hypothetical protein
MPKSTAIDPSLASRLAATGSGRNGPFNEVQDNVIKSHLDDWFKFAFVTNSNSGGRGSTGKLTKWKQERAKVIMEDPAFETYPADVSFHIRQSVQD